MFTHCGQPLIAPPRFGQRVYIAIGGIGRQLRVHHATPAAHVSQHAPQPLGDGGLLQPVRAKLLAVAGQQPCGHLIDPTPRHGQHRLTGALQRSAALALVGELAVGLPQQPFFDPCGQAAVGGQALVLRQLHRPVVLPGHVGRDELRHQALGQHVQHRSGLVKPPLQCSQKVAPDDGLVSRWRGLHASLAQLIHHMGQGRADVVEVSACPEKPRPVRGILHRVRKGNQLLVVVEHTGPSAFHHLGAHRGIAGTQQQQLVGLATGRTGVVVQGELGLPTLLGLLRRYPEHTQQLLVPASQAFILRLLQRAAAHTHPLQHPFHMAAAYAGSRVQPGGLGALGKPGVVNLVELGREFAAALHQPGNPARGAALAALNQGQINPITLTRQVFVAAKFDILWSHTQLAHHAPQLPHPQLHAQRHQRLATGAARPGHQHQQSIQHLPHLGGGGRGHVTGKHTHQIGVSHHTALGALEQVHKQLVLLQQPAQALSPGSIAHIGRHCFIGEKQTKPGRHRRLGRSMAAGIQHADQLGPEREHEIDRRVFQKQAHRLAGFGDDRILVKRHTKNLTRVVAQRRGV